MLRMFVSFLPVTIDRVFFYDYLMTMADCSNEEGKESINFVIKKKKKNYGV